MAVKKLKYWIGGETLVAPLIEMVAKTPAKEISASRTIRAKREGEDHRRAK